MLSNGPARSSGEEHRDGDRRHAFVIFLLADGFYPVNVLNAVNGSEVCAFLRTANPTEVNRGGDGRGGILGVVDGLPPRGVEDRGALARGCCGKLQAVRGRAGGRDG